MNRIRATRSPGQCAVNHERFERHSLGIDFFPKLLAAIEDRRIRLGIMLSWRETTDAEPRVFVFSRRPANR